MNFKEIPEHYNDTMYHYIEYNCKNCGAEIPIEDKYICDCLYQETQLADMDVSEYYIDFISGLVLKGEEWQDLDKCEPGGDYQFYLSDKDGNREMKVGVRV